MNLKFQNRGLSEHKRRVTLLSNNINNINSKSIQFHDPTHQLSTALKNIKHFVPTQLHLHGYLNANYKNKKMLPALPFKQSIPTKLPGEEKTLTLPNQVLCQHLRNSRNSQILNSLIQILKNDPDKTELFKSRNRKIKTQASCFNQFIQNREISSVKNCRTPKIIHNEIMMDCGPKSKRNLVSEQKGRAKLNSAIKPVSRKLDSFDEMEMTFYKPPKILSKERNLTSMSKQEENQFIAY